MSNREQQLLKIGFKRNNHQRSYELNKYDKTWRVNFFQISDYTDQRWDILVDDIYYDLVEVKKQYYQSLKNSAGYIFAQKEIKKKLLDKLNHLRSDYKDLTKNKMSKRNSNFKLETELQSKIALLKELTK